MTDTVIAMVTATPRPKISTSSGVSATSGMVCVTSAIGISARTIPGLTEPSTARRNATPRPAAMPSTVIGSVSTSAASSRSRALSPVGGRNR